MSAIAITPRDFQSSERPFERWRNSPGCRETISGYLKFVEMWKYFEELSRFKNLPHNWDAYGSVPPTDQLLQIAKIVLVACSTRFTLTSCHFSPMTGGGMSITLEIDQLAFDVSVLSDHHVDLLVCKDDEILYEKESMTLAAFHDDLDWLAR